MSFFLLKIFLMISVLLSVAFITLVERKILGYVQYRKGPNKVYFMGLFQPFADAVKLFTKEKTNLIWSNNMMFYFSPLFSLILMLLYWFFMSYKKSMGVMSSFEMMLVLVISSFSVYVILFSGWASNSKYSLLGAYRGVAQIISYEVSFSFILLTMILFSNSFNFNKIEILQKNSLNLLIGFFMIFIIWIIIILAETNRSPFDLSEGESELVSGFNVEYSGVMFAILFMAEYGNILFFSWMTSKLLLGGEGLIMENMMIIIMIFLLVRGTLVRYRYDKLMMMAWKTILPYSMMMLMMVLMLFML